MKRNNLLLLLFFAVLVCISCRHEIVTANVTASSSTNIINAGKFPKSVVYVEVNTNNIANAGCYTLKSSGQPLFDIAIIFAANINYDITKHKAVLYNNPQVSATLLQRAALIKPLQQKGIKVLLSILGNHQGAGISNFTSRGAARAFAKQLRDTVNFYNLDGIDFDDEYADYGNNGLPQPNDSSFTILVAELKSLMPDKLITFYYYGDATNGLIYRGVKAGTYLNYSWNAYYGSFIVPQVPGMDKTQLAPAADWINVTQQSVAKSLANKTISGGYGAYLFYDLTQSNTAKYLSAVSTSLYNDSTIVDVDCLQPPPY